MKNYSINKLGFLEKDKKESLVIKILAYLIVSAFYAVIINLAVNEIIKINK